MLNCREQIALILAWVCNRGLKCFVIAAVLKPKPRCIRAYLLRPRRWRNEGNEGCSLRDTFSTGSYLQKQLFSSRGFLPESAANADCYGGETARGDNAISNFVWLTDGHRNPHSWGKSGDNASGRARSASVDEELCVATLWPHSQTKECRHKLIHS